MTDHTLMEYLKPSKLKRQKRRDKRLHEELIECYRDKGRWTVKKRKGYDRWFLGDQFQHALKKESMRFRSGFTNTQTDNLAPIKRMLDKSVGQNWDQVYSRLCTQIDRNSVIGQHLFDHLVDFVYLKVYREDGKLYGTSQWGPPEVLKPDPWVVQYYVDPVSGLLKKIDKKKKRKKRRNHVSE